MHRRLARETAWPHVPAAAREASAVIVDEPIAIRQDGLGEERGRGIRQESPMDEQHGLAMSSRLNL